MKPDHFATFPPSLSEICIKAGTSEKGNCEECGKPWARVVEKFGEVKNVNYGKERRSVVQQGGIETTTLNGTPPTIKTTGWRPTCSHKDAGVVPATVLDPFGGSGTTAMVANQLSRHGISMDLSAEYLELAKERTGIKAIEEWEQGIKVEDNDFEGLPMFENNV